MLLLYESIVFSENAHTMRSDLVIVKILVTFCT